MATITCVNCGHKTFVMNKKVDDMCDKCGTYLYADFREKFSKKPEETKKEINVVISQQSSSTNLPQSGVLCLVCKSITPFGIKKCKNCRKKLNVNKRTIVYFDGSKNTVQCSKCGQYTSVESLKCEYCRKKLKF